MRLSVSTERKPVDESALKRGEEAPGGCIIELLATDPVSWTSRDLAGVLRQVFTWTSLLSAGKVTMPKVSVEIALCAIKALCIPRNTRMSCVDNDTANLHSV